jgi:hypothetical protein
MVEKAKPGVAAQKMDDLRREFWPDELPWRGAGVGEKGWFTAPRTLPLVLTLIGRLHKNKDLGSVYLELLSRQMGQGVVRIENEKDHAYSSGYASARSVRTWEERMATLEQLGFIKSVPNAGRKYGLVCLVHPTVAIQRLLEAGQIPKDEWWREWWATYQQRKADTKEPSYQTLLQWQAEDAAPPPIALVPPRSRQGGS